MHQRLPTAAFGAFYRHVKLDIPLKPTSPLLESPQNWYNDKDWTAAFLRRSRLGVGMNLSQSMTGRNKPRSTVIAMESPFIQKNFLNRSIPLTLQW
jgi:hypothetical protein